MEAEAVGTDAHSRRPATQSNPLIRANALRRMLTTGMVGVAVTAGTMLGAGTAAATEPVVLDACTGTNESSAFDQPILASPATLDAKVEQAMLLVHPLEFDLAKQAREEFLQSSSVQVGSVTEEKQTFSGTSLADAFAARVAALSAAGDRADEVNTHVRNLAAVGCLGGAGVSGQAKPAPPPPEPAPSTRDQPDPAPPTGQEQRNSPAPPAPGVAQPGGSAGYSTYGAAAPVRVLPPDYRSVPGSTPPWAQASQVPGLWPDVGQLHRQAEEEKRAEDEEAQVRAVGKAEALPTGAGNRVELPVLLAAISLAAVTSGLVRTWVLRRN